jgi:ABC-type phosphate transport system substrate-binding protein
VTENGMHGSFRNADMLKVGSQQLRSSPGGIGTTQIEPMAEMGLIWANEKLNGKALNVQMQGQSGGVARFGNVMSTWCNASVGWT